MHLTVRTLEYAYRATGNWVLATGAHASGVQASGTEAEVNPPRNRSVPDRHASRVRRPGTTYRLERLQVRRSAQGGTPSFWTPASARRPRPPSENLSARGHSCRACCLLANTARALSSLPTGEQSRACHEH